MHPKICFTLKKASELVQEKTTASGIRNDFLEGKYPLFYHSYKPENSFVAVPPEWLKELAVKADEKELVMDLGKAIKTISGEKERIIKKIREQRKRQSK